MLTQYRELKRNHPDSILFYRMGDFYEMFFEDAIRAAPLLEVQLTSRDKSALHPIPMCGVPYHAATGYIEKLVAHGMKVAICEQMEDPAQAKGIVKRDVTRIVTPSLVADPELVPEESSNYIVAIRPLENHTFEIATLDLLAAVVKEGILESDRLVFDLFCELSPKEILICQESTKEKWFRDLKKVFHNTLVTVRDFFFQEKKSAVLALQAYVKETQKTDALTSYFQSPQPLTNSKTLKLDPTTLNSLEVLRSTSQEGEGPSLFKSLDRTSTPMGKRLLKEWLCHPLTDLEAIEKRHSAVEALLDQPGTSQEIKKLLSGVRDLERLTTKTALGLAMPRDLVLIREILKTIPGLQSTLKDTRSARLKEIAKSLRPLEKLVGLLDSALLDEPASTLREGGIIRDSFHPQVKEFRELSLDAKTTIATIETRERKKTGISTLKIKYSRVFGYTIEISTSHLSKVPKDYTRKQTIANGERFITEELKRFEEKVESAEIRLKALEEKLFLEIRQSVSEKSKELLSNARFLSELDILLSFAIIAKERAYRRPDMHIQWDLKISAGRHPVIETILAPGDFVPNSIHFSESKCRTYLITGPNMAGKSTIMRQIALIVLMAHAGCFVPASHASIPITDSIFTRIGSSDDLARGRSTFMVEMTEVARILERATDKSLILVDEIGRGTSTYDGLSLAWSLLEYIHTELRAKTLFATHFRELTSLEKTFEDLQNANVLVRKWKDEIVFLHQLAPGICNESYGVEVAQLAGLPSKVLLRAKELLRDLENQSQKGNPHGLSALNSSVEQFDLFSDPKPLETLTRIDA